MGSADQVGAIEAKGCSQSRPLLRGEYRRYKFSDISADMRLFLLASRAVLVCSTDLLSQPKI